MFRRGGLGSRWGLLALAGAVLLPAAMPLGARAAAPAFTGPRSSQPVILTGAQIPGWAGAPATGAAAAYPSGASKSTGGDGVRDAHNGTLVAPPPGGPAGVDPNQIAAFRWEPAGWVEIPVQVDKKYLYFLANGHSSFSFYSGTDQELTFDWSPNAHATGEEAWKKVFGDCNARYEQAGAAGAAEYAAAVAAGVISPPAGGTAADYLGPMPDPVKTLTTQDEVVFMAGDAGAQAPAGQAPPAGAGDGRTIVVADPKSGATGFVYLFLKPGGSSFGPANGYVHLARDGNADQWIDRYSFAPADPEKIGTSNTGYGPNLAGDVCVTAAGNDAKPAIPAGTAPRASTDRQPRDGTTISTPTYRLYASGRWMVRQLQVTRPGTTGNYGPNLISRWKGRAFQQSPDSNVSVVGFEDEQVNWEMNSTLLGWKAGPVRAIREVWGADSGTNVTKTEIYYRDADVFHYHVRVHPIPPDGLYTSWDYRLGAVDTYYNQLTEKNAAQHPTGGVPIDGVNDNVGHVDKVPVSGQPAFFDSCDPTFDVCSAIDNPEEVAGPNGGLVYTAEFVGPTSLVQPAVVPYYRDDMCIDDGTGDGNQDGVGPALRPWPGENSTDGRVTQGYVDYWKAHGAPATLTAADLACNNTNPSSADLPWKRNAYEAAIGQHGLHFFVTGDSDNNFSPATTTEIDAQQWRYSVPMGKATNVLDAYGANVVTPLRASAVPYGSSLPPANVPEAPFAPLLAGAGLVVALGLLTAARRRRPASLVHHDQGRGI